MGNLGKAIGKAVVITVLYGLTKYATYRISGGKPVKEVYKNVKYEREHGYSQPRARAEKVILENVDFTVR